MVARAKATLVAVQVAVRNGGLGPVDPLVEMVPGRLQLVEPLFLMLRLGMKLRGQALGLGQRIGGHWGHVNDRRWITL